MRRISSTILELSAVAVGFATLTVALTYPLAFHLSTLGYKLSDVGDPQYSVWNIAWVAHSLLHHPMGVLDANIFFPHRTTLIYSEPNLVAGLLGVPVYWLTANPFATHNSVVLLSFVFSGTACYYLIRYLTHDRPASLIAAIGFAFCPFVFGHLPHIQLLMTGGIPLALLAFHRVVDRPSLWRGAMLGVAVATQALACAYYGVFVVLLLPLAAAVTAAQQRVWREARYWIAFGTAAAVAAGIVAPVLNGYMTLQHEYGFARDLNEARRYSANLVSYMTSSMYASAWIHGSNISWTDVLFPGFVALVAGGGAVRLLRFAPSPVRQYISLYAVITAVAMWLSFGPAAGLYSAAYETVPLLTFLRAPSRLGIIVTLGLSVMSAFSLAWWCRRTPRPLVWFAAIAAFAVAEHVVPIAWSPNPAIAPVYRYLATLPDGAVIEFPLFSRTHQINRTAYMLASTVHWKPLVNSYSDMTPPDFDQLLLELADFPSAHGFGRMRHVGASYAIFHLDGYRANDVEPQLEAALEAFAPFMTLLFRDQSTALYALSSYPEVEQEPEGSDSTRLGSPPECPNAA